MVGSIGSQPLYEETEKGHWTISRTYLLCSVATYRFNKEPAAKRNHRRVTIITTLQNI